MHAGGSSLLRPLSAPLVRFALLGVVAAAAGAPAAEPAGPAPDPSPLTSVAGPDPYAAPRAPAVQSATPFHGTVPVYVPHLSTPQAFRPPAAAPKPVRTVRALRTKPAARTKPAVHPKTVARAPGTAKPASEDGSALRVVALSSTAVDPPGGVSRSLALTLGLLVLLSAALVAAAARELTR